LGELGDELGEIVAPPVTVSALDERVPEGAVEVYLGEAEERD
jgi:hypothetical protein